VVRILARGGIEPTRLSAVSFAEFAPVADNETPQGRARNRRIEITLKPVAAPGEAAAQRPAGEPGAGPAPPARADTAGR
jgi:chemotaxis protein MotB